MNAVRHLAGRLGDPHVVLGGFVVGVLVLLTAVIFGGISDRLLREKGEKVRATFADTAMLAEGAPVRVEGVTQGRVGKIELNPDGRTTTAELEVFDDSLPLYADATAAVKFRNVLGGSNQVVLERGTPSSGELSSGVIPVEQTEGQVEVDQILAEVRDPERAGLRTMFEQMPVALSDAEAPARALEGLADAAPALEDGLDALRGESDGDLRRLVANAAGTAQALRDDPSALIDLVEGGAGALETTAVRSSEIEETIERTANLLPQIRTTLDRVDVTLAKADPLLARLRRPAGDLAPTVRVLRPTIVDAERLLQDARPLLASLRPAAQTLAAAARAARPTIDELEPSLIRLEENILPDLAKPDPVSKRATFQMIGPTGAGLGAAGASFDQGGHMLTLALGGGERALVSAPCRTYFTDPTAQQVVQCKEIAQAIGDLLSFQPLPAERPR